MQKFLFFIILLPGLVFASAHSIIVKKVDILPTWGSGCEFTSTLVAGEKIKYMTCTKICGDPFPVVTSNLSFGTEQELFNYANQKWCDQSGKIFKRWLSFNSEKNLHFCSRELTINTLNIDDGPAEYILGVSLTYKSDQNLEDTTSYCDCDSGHCKSR